MFTTGSSRFKWIVWWPSNDAVSIPMASGREKAPPLQPLRTRGPRHLPIRGKLTWPAKVSASDKRALVQHLQRREGRPMGPWNKSTRSLADRAAVGVGLRNEEVRV